jgi:addiction module HigA family antidote
MEASANPHPGLILRREFLARTGLSQNQLAQAIGVPGNRIHAIIKGARDITADTDLRLCRFFSLPEGHFLALQAAHDIRKAKHRVSRQLARIAPYKPGKAA